ncbi:MAG: hypothetical protein HQ525_09225, partial [Anaerolineae bacterium]|nr:hypothetical protein [Anaerolineae bacterium]
MRKLSSLMSLEREAQARCQYKWSLVIKLSVLMILFLLMAGPLASMVYAEGGDPNPELEETQATEVLPLDDDSETIAADLTANPVNNALNCDDGGDSPSDCQAQADSSANTENQVTQLPPDINSVESPSLELVDRNDPSATELTEGEIDNPGEVAPLEAEIVESGIQAEESVEIQNEGEASASNTTTGLNESESDNSADSPLSIEAVDQTELLVLDPVDSEQAETSSDEGEFLPLLDPKFCPGTVASNDPTCITLRGTITAAIADATTAGLAGRIYIESGTFTETVTINGFAVDLTLFGGWDLTTNLQSIATPTS